jgi:hypothetical protein
VVLATMNSRMPLPAIRAHPRPRPKDHENF